MKIIITLLATLSLISCSSRIQFKESDQEQLVHKVMHSTVKVGNERGHGTGFYTKVLNQDLVITNDHVCAIFKDGAPGYLESFDHTQVTDFSILQSDSHVDLCAIKFKAPYEMVPLSIAATTHYQEEIMVLGYPVLNPLMPSFGYLGDTQEDSLHAANEVQFISAQIFPGNSGSPVVDMNGNLVGVVSEGDNYTNRGLIVTHFHLATFLLGLI